MLEGGRLSLPHCIWYLFVTSFNNFFGLPLTILLNLRFITGTDYPVPLLGWRVDLDVAVYPRHRFIWWYRLSLVIHSHRQHWLHVV